MDVTRGASKALLRRTCDRLRRRRL